MFNVAPQIKVLRQLLAAAFIDQVAVRKDKVDKATSSGTQWTNCKGVPYRAMGIAEDVFIHPSSALTGNSPPEYVVYHEVIRTTRVWLKGRLITFASNRGAQLNFRSHGGESFLAILPGRVCFMHLVKAGQERKRSHDVHSSIWSRGLGTTSHKGRFTITKR